MAPASVATLQSFVLAPMCAPHSKGPLARGGSGEGCGGEPRGLLCCFRSNYHVTNSGVTGGAGILGVVTF